LAEMDKQEITTLGEEAKVKDVPENLVVMLRVKKGAEPERGYQITRTPVSIGRDNICGISINDTRMSRQHAALFFYQPDFYLKDLGSTNGSFINDKRIKNAPLRNGDVIRLGNTEFEFILSDVSKGKD
jgi:pSer/pThr/pTyr-binding forkhead associated (FHA) protein